MAPPDAPRRPGILKNESVDPNNISNPALSGLQVPSPRSTPKSVSIAPKGELISPLILGDTKDVDALDLDDDRSPRRPRVKPSTSKHRLSGRPRQQGSISSLQQWLDDAAENDTESSTGHPEHHLFNSGLVGQLAQWVRDEKVKRDARRARRKARTAPATADPAPLPLEAEDRPRRDSDDSVDLDTLEQIIKDTVPSSRRFSRLSLSGRSRGLGRRSQRGSTAASTDNDNVDGEAMVPAAEVVLDNSQTMSYKGGAARSSTDLSLSKTPTVAEDAWLKFKFEVLRLIHTLRLKGWRRVPLEMSPDISIDRLSGALTNAVYVVSPPEDLPETPAPETSGAAPPRPPRKVPRLLLRIYGPQVEHLIDRESELQILRRLARRHIGPRMLGTFINGRFEEFFNAKALTPEELRNPDTSRHIAKRMREMHDGIELLESERQAGPFVWQNWDKWLGRVQSITEWLDDKVEQESGSKGQQAAYVCGIPWARFHDTVFTYRKWLEKEVGGSKKLLQKLLFAHNDTQYGNILRMLPSSTSPLLLPANSHKQLVVIDFEYSNANTVGLEFANHFSEWAYNYHDETAPWRCHHNLYPKLDEQERFLRAYLRHRPDFNITTPRLDPLDSVPESGIATPRSTRPPSASIEEGTGSQTSRPTSSQSNLPSRPKGPSHSISNLMLDARTPQASSSNLSSGPSPSVDSDGGSDTSSAEDAKVSALLYQTRLWRMANSAQWVAWGIVQAKIPGMPDFDDAAKADGSKNVDNAEPDGDKNAGTSTEAKGVKPALTSAEEERADKEIAEEAHEEEAEAEFDYLSYARDRAMFFWGDAVVLGFVKLADLPKDVQRDIKIIDY